MAADKSAWNDAVKGIFSTQLSASKYSLNTIEAERLCHVTPSKSSKTAPKGILEERKAWHEYDICKGNCSTLAINCNRCDAKMVNAEGTERPILQKDTSKVPQLIALPNASQIYVKIDINDSQIKKVWGPADEKQLESESLLSNDSNRSSTESKGRRNNRKNAIVTKIGHYFPYFLVTVSILQIGVFIWDRGLRRWLVYAPSQRHQIWRFATYALMHSDELHLMLNVVLQIIIGASLEFEQGWIRTAVVYVGGCVAGAMGSSVLEPMLYICGSSGGVYAMLLSHLPHIWLNWDTIKFKKYRLCVVAILVISDSAYTIAHWLIHTNTNPTISLPAHGIGAISGVLIGMVIYKGTTNSDVYIKFTKVFSALLLVLSVILTILFNLRYIVIFYD